MGGGGSGLKKLWGGRFLCKMLGLFAVVCCILFAFTLVILINFFCVASVDFDRISEQKFRPLKKCAPCERITDFEPFFFKGFNSFFF